MILQLYYNNTVEAETAQLLHEVNKVIISFNEGDNCITIQLPYVIGKSISFVYNDFLNKAYNEPKFISPRMKPKVDLIQPPIHYKVYNKDLNLFERGD